MVYENKIDVINDYILASNNIEDALFNLSTAILRMEGGTYCVDETEDTLNNYRYYKKILRHFYIQIRKIDETRCSCNADVLDVEFPRDFEQIILSRINAPEYYWNFYFKHLDRRIE